MPAWGCPLFDVPLSRRSQPSCRLLAAVKQEAEGSPAVQQAASWSVREMKGLPSKIVALLLTLCLFDEQHPGPPGSFFVNTLIVTERSMQDNWLFSN